MTPNELTTIIAARFGKETDINYRRWLMPQINVWRSRFIRNSLEKNPKELYAFLQTITIPMKYGNVTCGGYTCMGSYSEITPKLLRIGNTPFHYLGAVDGKSPYRYNDAGTSAYLEHSASAKYFHAYEYPNGQVIIPNKNIKVLRGTAIFDEPDRAAEWECSTLGTTGCDWWNADYPISGDIVAMIKTAIFDELGVPRDVLPEKQDQDV